MPHTIEQELEDLLQDPPEAPEEQPAEEAPEQPPTSEPSEEDLEVEPDVDHPADEAPEAEPIPEDPDPVRLQPGDSAMMVRELQEIHMRRARDMVRERQILSALGSGGQVAPPTAAPPRTRTSSSVDVDEILARLPVAPPRPTSRPVPPARPGGAPRRPADLLPPDEDEE